MANITDPQVCMFLKEDIRPNCETMRGLKAILDSVSARYNGITLNNQAWINAAPDDVIVDERDYVSKCTKNDVTAVMIEVEEYRAQLADATSAATIEKPCVRALNVTQ